MHFLVTEETHICHKDIFFQGFDTTDLTTEDVGNLAIMAMKGELPDVPGPAQNAIEEKLQIKVIYT